MDGSCASQCCILHASQSTDNIKLRWIGIKGLDGDVDEPHSES